MERTTDKYAIRLQDLLATFDCAQHVPHIPTHLDGGPLDFVIIKSEQISDDVIVQSPNAVCDHSVIT